MSKAEEMMKYDEKKNLQGNDLALYLKTKLWKGSVLCLDQDFRLLFRPSFKRIYNLSDPY